MGKFDNLNDSQLPDILRRIRNLETASPMNNAAIGRGGIEVYDQGTINVSDGNLIVNGTATISGILNADGTVTLSGTIAISGPLTVSGNTDITGDLDVDGPMTTTGTLSVEGVSTLKNDLNVTGAGKIIAGQTTIRPSGTINFGDTLTISPADEFGPAGISDGFARYYLTPAGSGGYMHQFQGGAYVEGPIYGHGGLEIDDLPTKTGGTANLYMDPATGVIKRII